MPFDTLLFVVQRPGLTGDGALFLRAAPGSPLSGRHAYVTGGSGQRFENIPEISKAQRAEVLFLDDLKADVRLGDLVTLPAALIGHAADGALRRIIQVRPYTFSLQCGLQRMPFAPLPCWLPQDQDLRTRPGAALAVTDLAYDPAPPVLGYLEPAPDMVKAAVVGSMSERACFAFTLAPLARDTILTDPRGAAWIAVGPSDVWPLPGDCRTLMRELLRPPAGVGVP